MYLKKSYNKKTGRTQLFIVEAYRDKDKKPKAKVIRTLGYLDVLEKKYEDPISYFTCLARQMTADRNRAFQNIELIINPSETVNEPAKKLNFGCVALMQAYGELGMDKFFTSIYQMSKSEYKLNIILRNAVCLCLIYPSYRHSPADKRNITLMFGNLDYAISDFYRASDLAGKYKDQMLKFIYGKLKEIQGEASGLSDRIEQDFYDFEGESFERHITPDEFYDYIYKNLFSDIDENSFNSITSEDRNVIFEKLIDSIRLMRFIGYVLCLILAKKMDFSYSAKDILISLRKCDYIYVDRDIYMLEYWDELLNELGKVMGIDFTLKFRKMDEILTLIRA